MSVSDHFKRSHSFHSDFAQLRATEEQLHALVFMLFSDFRKPNIDEVKAAMERIECLSLEIKELARLLNDYLAEAQKEWQREDSLEEQ